MGKPYEPCQLKQKHKKQAIQSLKQRTAEKTKPLYCTTGWCLTSDAHAGESGKKVSTEAIKRVKL